MSSNGQVKDMVNNYFSQEEGNTVSFVLTQDERPFVSSDIGFSMAVLPFNNRIIVQYFTQTLVNTNQSASITDATILVLPDYTITAQILIRKKTYPYTLYSKFPHPKAVFTKQRKSFVEVLSLDPEYSQVDMSNEAEIVFDFSDMVINTYDSNRDIRNK